MLITTTPSKERVIIRQESSGEITYYKGDRKLGVLSLKGSMGDIALSGNGLCLVADRGRGGTAKKIWVYDLENGGTPTGYVDPKRHVLDNWEEIKETFTRSGCLLLQNKESREWDIFTLKNRPGMPNLRPATTTEKPFVTDRFYYTQKRDGAQQVPLTDSPHGLQGFSWGEMNEEAASLGVLVIESDDGTYIHNRSTGEMTLVMEHDLEVRKDGVVLQSPQSSLVVAGRQTVFSSNELIGAEVYDPRAYNKQSTIIEVLYQDGEIIIKTEKSYGSVREDKLSLSEAQLLAQVVQGSGKFNPAGQHIELDPDNLSALPLFNLADKTVEYSNADGSFEIVWADGTIFCSSDFVGKHLPPRYKKREAVDTLVRVEPSAIVFMMKGGGLLKVELDEIKKWCRDEKSSPKRYHTPTIG